MSGRPMKFPYTIAAKITRFPFHHYFVKSETGWVFRYWAISILICAPLWYKFQQLSHNPENVKKWDEIHKHQFSGEMHH
ncbi:hypothetical protein HZU73_05291 [Apis mellifera caucasica]|uniref:Uncharacterized protein LOC726118 n=1 Tax=Apis mellifera TaxID=7460 RepID=A0A7M7FYW9_APIME|nr:uncharacterized protein LOC726118 [Apis mellifera]KAG6799188.1 hypothetical protein HZU73_05291 [Apis mellifera caucasica]KAG9433890.1 hypothetical protein HZU67_04441 [Apis mellifera carnica]|eukprot:XP_001120695.1 uncharacterized protein LOC726118 [Apis mellifera]